MNVALHLPNVGQTGTWLNICQTLWSNVVFICKNSQSGTRAIIDPSCHSFALANTRLAGYHPPMNATLPGHVQRGATEQGRSPSLKPFLKRRGMWRRCCMRPVPVVRLRMALTLQLSAHLHHARQGAEQLAGSAELKSNLMQKVT